MEMTMQPLMAGSNTKQSVRNSIGTDDYSNYKKPLIEVGWDEGASPPNLSPYERS